ncbi:sugar transporter [Salipiger sp.]|uniref:sugar transporter n=1 Tax=Salipiger sp. TaxID=2078585 RepID=UPI003A96AC7F
MLLSFIACVILPSIVTALYLWLVAEDQYVSRVGFTVRQEDSASAVDLLGGLTNLSSSSSSDTDILYEFIQSQKLVSDIDAQLDLHTIWTRPEWDPVFALEDDASIEELLSYWEDMVRISYSSGLIEVEVRAFRAEDATLVAQALLDESADVINELSSVAREDAISYARDELEEAVERLKEARETVTLFRNENQLVDPQLDLQSQAGLLGTLQGQEAEQIIELDLLRETSQANDPRVAQGERRLEVIRSRIAAERQKLGFDGGTGPGGQAFADLVGDYERLAVDREFAEQSYVSALAAYDAARADAKRKNRYLAAYMKPTSAETAEYPKRGILLMMTTLFLFLLWATVVLVLYSVKDRR